jgi:hypothetical protein
LPLRVEVPQNEVVVKLASVARQKHHRRHVVITAEVYEPIL